MDQSEVREKIGCGKKSVGKIFVARGSQWEEEFGVRTEEKWRERQDWVGGRGIAFAIGDGVKVHGIALVIG